MAIQMRRGAYSAFDASKMVPGELAVILSGDPDISDGKSVVCAFAAGNVKKFLMREDAPQLIADVIGEAMDLSITAGNDAIEVTANTSDDGVSYTISHRALYSNGASGVDPAAASIGTATSLGTTQLDFGDGFWVPCASIDRYGHVTALSYREIKLPSTATATVERIGMVRPDGVSIRIDADGVIRALRPEVDDELSDTSENAVQNKVVKAALDELDAKIDGGLAGVYDYKGTVAAYEDLPTSGLTAGDVYNVEAAHGTYPAGTNYAWTGEAWDALGGSIDLSGYATLASPALTGTPTAPTASTGTDTTQIATTAFVQQEIDANAYELPTATDATLGGVMEGDGVSIVGDGKLSLGPLVQSASGESVETDGCALHSIEAEGWSEQVSTTGKNLLDTSGLSSITTNGITYTRNADGSFTAVGTATSAAYWTIATSIALDAGTYSIGGANGVCKFEVIRADGTRVSTNNNSSATFTLSAGETLQRVRIRVENGTAVDATVYPQLEAGSTATNYEPYTGGKPSPSPDYPQEIKVARGRNLVDEANALAGYINSSGDISGVSTPDTINRHSDYIPVTGGETYNLSFAQNNGGNCYAGWYDESKNQISLFNYSGITTDGKAVTAPSNAKYIRVSWVRTENQYCQLELGSTPTPYVPYGHVGLEVQGRNLWDEEWESGSIDASSGANVNNASEIRSKNYIPLMPNTDYYFYCGSSMTGNIKSRFYDADKNYIGYVTQDGNAVNYNRQFTPPANARYMRFAHQASYGTVYKNDTCINVSDPDFNGQYEPYTHTTTPIPLPLKSDGERWAGGLPDGTADVLTLDSAGRWEWTNKNDFDVSSDATGWSLNGTSTRDGIACTNFIKAFVNKAFGKFTSINGEMMCNGLQSYDTGDALIPGQYSQRNNSVNVEVVIPSSSASTVAEFATWLASNNLTFLYKLATPTTEHGYIDMPDLPEGATVTIPELEGFGCSWFVAGAAELVEHAANWGRRSRAEDEEIEDAIADLATRVAALES